jgi:hypothetical protein
VRQSRVVVLGVVALAVIVVLAVWLSGTDSSRWGTVGQWVGGAGAVLASTVAVGIAISSHRREVDAETQRLDAETRRRAEEAGRPSEAG